MEMLELLSVKGMDMADEKKTLKFQMMMTPAEAEILDDWMFANRVRSRAEAIRRLWQMALLQGEKLDKVSSLVDWSQGWAEEAFSAYCEDNGLKIDINETLPSNAPRFLDHAKTSAGISAIAAQMLNNMKAGADLPELEEVPDVEQSSDPARRKRILEIMKRLREQERRYRPPSKKA